MANQIGPWKLGDRLGTGGQGAVFEGTREEGTVAAVKVINVTRPKKRARFVREIKTHAHLSEENAANIIPVIDHNLEELQDPENGVRGYIAMPRAVCSLDDRYDLYRHRTELCLETFLGIINGVRSAHRVGAIHRDLKPANILFLDESLRVPMVSDFGICFLRESSDSVRVTDEGETVGARFFMAPEQERGDVTEVTPSADIYALGKLLHFMITSRHLHREKLSEAFREEELESDQRLVLVRDELLARMVIEEPSGRIQSAEELYTITSEILRSFRRHRSHWLANLLRGFSHAR